MSKLINKNTWKEFKWQNFLGLTIAGLVNAIGVAMFLAPVNLIDSGISGTSLFLNQVVNNPHMTLSLFLLILNVPFYIIGLKKQGFVFTIYSLYAIIMYSMFAYLIQHVIPFDFSGGSPVAGNDILLCAIFGGIISGMGSGLTIRFGGALDGVEVMAVVFAKHMGLTVGTFVMIYNAILYIIAGAVIGSYTIPLYSIVTYMAGLKAVDFVVEGFDRAKAAVIVTKKKEEVSKAISETMGRGITILDAEGYYSKEAKAFIYVVVNRFQIGKLKNVIFDIDPQAFVTITLVADTFGQSVKLAAYNKNKKNFLAFFKGKKHTIMDDVIVDTNIKPNIDNIPCDSVESSPCDNAENISCNNVENLSCDNAKDIPCSGVDNGGGEKVDNNTIFDKDNNNTI